MPTFHVKVSVDDDAFSKQQLIDRLAKGLAGLDAELEITGGGAVRRKVTDDIKQQIIEGRRDKGMNYAELASTFGVSTAVINKVLRDAGLTNKREAGESTPKGTRVTISADGSAHVEEPQAANA